MVPRGTISGRSKRLLRGTWWEQLVPSFWFSFFPSPSWHWRHILVRLTTLGIKWVAVSGASPDPTLLRSPDHLIQPPLQASATPQPKSFTQISTTWLSATSQTCYCCPYLDKGPQVPQQLLRAPVYMAGLLLKAQLHTLSFLVGPWNLPWTPHPSWGDCDLLSTFPSIHLHLLWENLELKVLQAPAWLQGGTTTQPWRSPLPESALSSST